VDIAHDLGRNMGAVANWHKEYGAGASFEDRPQSGRRHATSTTTDQTMVRMAQTLEDPTNAAFAAWVRRTVPTGSRRMGFNGSSNSPNLA